MPTHARDSATRTSLALTGTPRCLYRSRRRTNRKVCAFCVRRCEGAVIWSAGFDGQQPERRVGRA
eukprot:12962-Eustigmatos_ZCMA.PRE.1